MSHRLSLFVGALALVGAGCSDELPASNCLIEKYRIDGTPLTLLPDARLDRVGAGFVLLGSDGDNVRWASLGTDGVIGAERAVTVPAHVGQPWFAVAGINGPMDHVVVAFVPAGSPPTGAVDLMTFSVAFDSPMPSPPAVLGQIPAAAQVAMGSGRGGMHAGLAWAVPGGSNVSARILGGDGRTIGSDLVLADAGAFGNCLRFSPGKGDLTVGYVDMSGVPPAPKFRAIEISAAGTAQPAFSLQVGTEPPGCVELAPTDTGYGVAWHSDRIGTFFGVYEPAIMQFPTHLILGDVLISPEAGPMNLGGLGWMGKQYGVVFTRATGAEVWPFDALGQRKGSLPVFPSAVGHTGSVSTQPVDRVLYATYADYQAPVDKSAGIRFLVKVSCP